MQELYWLCEDCSYRWRSVTPFSVWCPQCHGRQLCITDDKPFWDWLKRSRAMAGYEED